MAIVFVVVGLLVLALLAALHRYLWVRLVRDTTDTASVPRRLGTVLFVVAPLLTLATFVGARAGLPIGVVRVIAWPGYLWAVVFLYLLLAVLVGEVLRPLLLRIAARRGKPDDAEPAATELTRRRVIARALAGAGAVAAVATVGIGTYGVLRGPRVLEVDVPLAKLPPEAAGFRLAVVSDTHIGPVLAAGFTRTVVDTVNATNPDAIVVVGDLVDGDVDDLRPDVAPFADLRAPHGVFFVTGNHEYISGAQQWVDYLPQLGMRVLLNERVALPGFDLAGVNDLAGEDEGNGPDLEKAMAGRDPARPVVLLAHQPAFIEEARAHGVDLQISGHTHGGQVFPGNLLARLANPTLFGLERYGDTQLYVTRGAGAWGPPVRTAAPSDITVLTLTRP
ncbi:metallophosphoesterase [Nocardia asteroides]|uniref:metallophosphoesterase n=1 Tax=Nocardia asteroides TaxID=1824 RepID=UPI001E3473D5|nr:metallophosphoesterase [Nocardia asteroides]UGT63886.1 metallophosphoesterase [Nocardia asteroides]